MNDDVFLARGRLLYQLICFDDEGQTRTRLTCLPFVSQEASSRPTATDTAGTTIRPFLTAYINHRHRWSVFGVSDDFPSLQRIFSSQTDLVCELPKKSSQTKSVCELFFCHRHRLSVSVLQYPTVRTGNPIKSSTGPRFFSTRLLTLVDAFPAPVLAPL